VNVHIGRSAVIVQNSFATNEVEVLLISKYWSVKLVVLRLHVISQLYNKLSHEFCCDYMTRYCLLVFMLTSTRLVIATMLRIFGLGPILFAYSATITEVIVIYMSVLQMSCAIRSKKVRQYETPVLTIDLFLFHTLWCCVDHNSLKLLVNAADKCYIYSRLLPSDGVNSQNNDDDDTDVL